MIALVALAFASSIVMADPEADAYYYNRYSNHQPWYYAIGYNEDGYHSYRGGYHGNSIFWRLT